MQLLVVALLIAAPLSLSAQTTDGAFDKALSTSLANVVRAMHATIRTNLLEAAERMEDADYAFRPTPVVRSFGQVVGHVANNNYFFCSHAADGEPRPPSIPNFETLSDRTTLLKGL